MDNLMLPKAGRLSWTHLRFWYQESLVNRATGMGLALAGAVMLVIFAIVFKLASDLVQRAAAERLDAAAAQNALRLEAEIERVLAGLDNLSHRSLLARGFASSSPDEGGLRTVLFEFRQGFPAVKTLSLVDAAGHIVSSASANPVLDMAVQARAVSTRQAAYALKTSSSAARLHFAYPVSHSPNGPSLGVVAGDVDLLAVLAGLRLLSETVDHQPLGVSVVDGSGHTIYRSENRIAGDVLSASAPVAGRLASRGVDLHLHVEVPRAAAYAPLYWIAGMALLLGLAVLAMVVLMVRKIALTILRPLQEMSQHAMAVASTGPAGLRELPVSRSDEIGIMGIAFNEMVNSLRQAYDSQEATVSERTRELAGAQERLARVLAAIDVVVYVTDPAFSQLTYINPATELLFGMTPEQFLAQPSYWQELVVAEDAPRREAARQALAAGAPAEVRYRIRRPDGSIRWVKDRCHLVHDAETGQTQVSGLMRDVTAQMEAEALLRLRERALASSSCGVIIADMMQPGQPVLYVNEAFERITGYAAEDILGRNCALLQGDPAENTAGLAEIRNAIASGGDCKVVLRNYRKDGEPFWNELRISPLCDANGRVTHYIGIQNDITANIMATQALVESEQRLALTIDALHEGVWDWHIPENCFITSPSWAGILGIDARSLPAKAGFSLFIEQVPTAWARHVQSEFDAHLAGSESEFYLDHQMCHADGRIIWVANHGRIVERDAAGRPLRMVGTIVDITQRIESSQQIIGLMAQLDSVFTLSPDAFIYFNETGRVTFVNPAFERLTGIQAGESTGLSRQEIRQLLQERSDPTHAFPWFDISQSREDQDDQLMYLLHPVRRVLLVSWRAGEGCAAVIYMRDVTRETEVDRMKSEFLTTAAHELRTPMASIMGFAELLILRDFPPERTKDMLNTIHRQARRLTDLINELLDLARIEARAGKDFKISRQSVVPVIRDAVAALHVEGDRSRMQLHLPDGLPEVDIDSAKMQQAIINVLSNAYKYSPKGGPIDISTRRRERGGNSQVAIVVCDHGIGMSHEQAARIFERFFRADPSGNIPGTGLGMSLVKEIMESHGGSVEVDSEVGEGTSVSLWLPVHGDGGRLAPNQESSGSGSTHGELTLWLDSPGGSGQSSMLH